MSIDARVETVICNEDGSGELRLVDRPARPGGVPGIKGQPALAFNRAPEEVTALNGLDIRGGASSIILGDLPLARRVGCGRIEFVDAEAFKAAVAFYRQKRMGWQA